MIVGRFLIFRKTKRGLRKLQRYIVQCDWCKKYDYVTRNKRKFCSFSCSSRAVKRQTRITAPKTEEEAIARHKVCVFCSVEYCDVTLRCVGKTCSKRCSSLMMSQTRKKNGSYARSDRQNELLSKTLREKYANGWVAITPETRMRIIEKTKEAFITGIPQEKARQTSRIKYGVDHWTQTQIGRDFMSKIASEYVRSDETRAAMSRSQRCRLRTKRETHYTSAHGGWRDDLCSYFRSCWEANFARILNFCQIKWSYEEHSFELDTMSSYTPDFRVGEFYVELKGRWSEESKEKFNKFKCLYQDVKVLLIESEQYSILRECFKHVIVWEGK